MPVMKFLMRRIPRTEAQVTQREECQLFILALASLIFATELETKKTFVGRFFGSIGMTGRRPLREVELNDTWQGIRQL